VSAFVNHKHSISRTLGFLAAIGSLVWLVLSIQWFRGTSNVPLLRVFRKSDRVLVVAQNRHRASFVFTPPGGAVGIEDTTIGESVVVVTVGVLL
jgi:hypothetical protein